jgi:hypothetical protein
MKRLIAVAAVFCMIFMASVMAPSTKAQNEQNGDRKTVVTFSEPIEIPGGKILPAGTYFFKLLNQDTGRWVVQIFDKNQTHTFATLITVQDFRYHPTDKVVMTFDERAAGQPPAIKEWFFPGENFGREFVYGRQRATELAKQVNEPVLSTPAEETAPVEPATPAQTSTYAQTPVTAVTPVGQEVPAATVVQAQPAPAPTTPAPVTDLPLPHTASSAPLVGLIGLLAICAAFGLVVRTKRSA